MDPFIGQIMAVAFNFAPNGWALCNGQLLSIAQNNALFALLGTTYGGNGTTTFALPDLRGKTLIGTGQGASNYVLGQITGSETVTLAASQIPAHVHAMTASADVPAVGGAAESSLGSAGRTGLNIFAAGATNPVTMGSNTSSIGGGGAHNNMQPSLAINYCIALEGVFPPRP